MQRYFEPLASFAEPLSVVKKRSGRHENTIREYRQLDEVSRSGRHSSQFNGILSGIPEYAGDPTVTDEP